MIVSRKSFKSNERKPLQIHNKSRGKADPKN